jgi:hypothetical protein
VAQLKEEIRDKLGAGLQAAENESVKGKEADLADSTSCEAEQHLPIRLHSLSDLGQRCYHVLREYGGDKDGQTTLAAAGIRDQAVLLAWDGVCVDGVPVSAGEGHRPTRLQVQYLRGGGKAADDFLLQMPVSTKLKELRQILASRLSIEPQYLLLHRLDQVGSAEDMPLHLGEDRGGETLQKLGLESGVAGDHCIPLVAEMAGTGEEPAAVAMFQQQQRTLAIEVEDRYTAAAGAGPAERKILEVERTASLRSLKEEAIALFGLDVCPEETHLRVLDDSTRPSGLGWLLLDEKAKVGAAGVKASSTITLEKGSLPSVTNRLVLRFRLGTGPEADIEVATAALHSHFEIIVDREASLKEAVEQMKSAAAITEGEWHACKTNWYGPAVLVGLLSFPSSF